MGAAAEDGEVDLTVRTAGTGDAEGLADLFIAARRAAYPAMPRPVHGPEAIHAWFRELTHTGREVWVAEQDDALAGYLLLDPDWLDSLYVRPDLTGQGVGSVLMELAKTLRPDGFALWVFESNVAAQRFYRRHGLEVAERTDGSHNEEKSPDLRMAWPGAVADLRARINAIDVQLARLLNDRAGITARIQRLKPVPGHAGRDPAREAEIFEAMAGLAPNLGPERVAAIMDVVISVSLDAADASTPDS